MSPVRVRPVLRSLVIVVVSACSSSPSTSVSAPAAPTAPAFAAGTTLSEATLPIPVSFTDVCRLEASVCANNGEFGPYGPFPPDFGRPLKLPTVDPGRPCPVSDGTRIGTVGFGGFALGTGLSRPVVTLPLSGDPANGIPLSAQARDGWYGFKTLWFTDPSYQGPVLIRGARIDAAGSIAFGEAPDVAELIIPPGPTLNEASDGYRTAPGGTYVKTPGCYAWQVDGVGFSTVLVFRAVSARTAPP
jgi:hypothetical protein